MRRDEYGNSRCSVTIWSEGLQSLLMWREGQAVEVLLEVCLPLNC